MAWPSTGSYTAWSKCFKCTTQATKISAVNSWYFFDLALMPPEFWAEVQVDGDDLVFVEDDLETPVNHKLIFIDTGTSKGLVAVAQPHGASGATADIDSYCFVGNAGASSTSTSSTFPSTMTCLYMLQEAPTSSTAVRDWTSNARHSTSIVGSMTSGDLVSGGPHAGLKYINFDNNDRINIPSTIFDAAETDNAYTWFGWVQIDDDTANRGIFGAAGTQMHVRYDEPSNGFMATQRNSANSGNFTSGASTGISGAWDFVCVVYNGSTLKTFLNGANVSSATATSLRSAALSFYIGHDNTTYCASELCEIGMYSAALSDDQIATIYANETDSGFWVVTEHTGSGANVGSFFWGR